VKTLTATRYVTPLREGGSLPAIVEASDDGLYVVKFVGAGQGRKALIAELLSGELARALGLRIPELVLIEIDARMGKAEPHDEIRDLLKASVGLNLALDYLPGSMMFDPIADPAPSAAEASEIVWFDAFTLNVDRTARNANLLRWHKQLWLIDHGASLYFHHSWESAQAQSQKPFAAVKAHVLLPYASALPAAEQRLRPLITSALLTRLVAEVPDVWLEGEPGFSSVDEHRRAYVDFFERRLLASGALTAEAERARAQLV
jgi:hypothetical protein